MPSGTWILPGTLPWGPGAGAGVAPWPAPGMMPGMVPGTMPGMVPAMRPAGRGGPLGGVPASPWTATLFPTGVAGLPSLLGGPAAGAGGWPATPMATPLPAFGPIGSLPGLLPHSPSLHAGWPAGAFPAPAPVAPVLAPGSQADPPAAAGTGPSATGQVAGSSASARAGSLLGALTALAAHGGVPVPQPPQRQGST